MARYFFHVVSHSREYADARGQEFSDLMGAKAYAARIACELAQEGSYEGSICIEDEYGNELDHVSIGGHH
jgi:hypothetical protein